MAQWLLDRGITSVGTLQSNRKRISTEIKEIKDRETNSYEIYWEKEDNGTSNLHSYVIKTKRSGKRTVFIIINSATALEATKDDNEYKPAIYQL